MACRAAIQTTVAAVLVLTTYFTNSSYLHHYQQRQATPHATTNLATEHSSNKTSFIVNVPHLSAKPSTASMPSPIYTKITPPVAYPVKDVVTKKEAATRSWDSTCTQTSTATTSLASASSTNSTCLTGAWCSDRATTIVVSIGNYRGVSEDRKPAAPVECIAIDHNQQHQRA
eukprot:782172-Amphidinium_carterae.1